MSQGVNMGHGTETGQSGRVMGSTHSCARAVQAVNTQHVAGGDTVNAGVPQILSCTSCKTKEQECSRVVSYQYGGDEDAHICGDRAGQGVGWQQNCRRQRFVKRAAPDYKHSGAVLQLQCAMWCREEALVLRSSTWRKVLQSRSSWSVYY